MSYRIKYSDEAKKDRKAFNNYQLEQIDKAVLKVSKNPLPQNEGGYGKPLGHKQGRNLTGLCKIVLKKLGIRVVYELVRKGDIMEIIVIAARNDEEVYDIALKRIN
ncbi:MAG: type II toxin-antitoxin system RelE/ParE family toxin [Oscillospiraceae bacterium]|nr:type II toxin-antitoxin system RelE/ParE family toxin [Oscillospiraceae bacterium]